jgi:hypothetical protein
MSVDAKKAGVPDIPLLPYEKAKLGDGSTKDRLAELMDADPDKFAIDDEGKKSRKPVEDDDADDADDGAESDDEGDEGDEGDDGEELEGDEDGDDGEDGDGEDLYEVQVDGEDLKVSLDELKKRYGQEASFTKKSQRLADAKKAFEAEAAETRAEVAETRQLRTKYAQRLEVVERLLEESAPQEPDDALLDRDPKAYMRQQALFDRHQRKMQIIGQEQNAVAGEDARDQGRADAATLEVERKKLVKAIPEWSDPKVAEKEGTELVGFLSELGYTQQQVEGLSDHRMILLLRDAMKFRGLQQKGKKIAARPGKTLKPGGRDVAVPGATRRSKKQAKRVAQKRERLARSGKVNDAQSAIFELLDD